MTNTHGALVLIEQVIERVDALHTLGASLAAGIQTGVVAPDHVQTLLGVIASDLKAHLAALCAQLRTGDG